MFNDLLNSINRRVKIQKARLKDEIHGIIDRAYFKDRAGVDRTKNKINFVSIVWGNDFLHAFFSYTIPSLLQDGNIPTLAREGYDLKYTIYTQLDEYQEIAKGYDSCLSLLNENVTVKIISLGDLEEGWWRGYYWHNGTSALIDQIKTCIDEDAAMFFAPPDSVFGNHSVTNVVKTVEGKDVCLAAPNARVRRDSIMASGVFDRLKNMETTIENDELVDLAFEHGHPALLESFDNVDTNRTHRGLSIRKINESTYSIIHNLPTVYLANFVADDLEHFTRSWASWDRRWPRLLMRHNRLKVVGSSDLFFCVELTKNDRPGRIRKQSGLLNNDKLIKQERYLHNYVCNSFCCVWRGSGDRSRSSSDELVQQPRID